MISELFKEIDRGVQKFLNSVDRVVTKYVWADMVVRYSVTLGALILAVVLLPILAPFALWGSFLKDEGEE